jgi:hypothetical protein
MEVWNGRLPSQPARNHSVRPGAQPMVRGLESRRGSLSCKARIHSVPIHQEYQRSTNSEQGKGRSFSTNPALHGAVVFWMPFIDFNKGHRSLHLAREVNQPSNAW